MKTLVLITFLVTMIKYPTGDVKRNKDLFYNMVSQDSDHHGLEDAAKLFISQ